ncbi:DNA adenine methylase [Flagellimonas abyssi]|uniref:DNA adenine methylase n=1 Tax=Flagellimonas abyssi TaxID=2864871 RepID=A0ABS7EV68_9FLAO|nr:DNA adenine methylase [Allomuricauda abyssi]MBW8200899.1 DNA adenine methylase [Allomuricauda abyssi]
MGGQLSMFETKQKNAIQKVVNVASIPQRSPFRYPGGKTWLIPVVRQWLKQSKEHKKLIEPFAGGGIVSLTAAFENLADNIVMIELDHEVAAVWEVIINGDQNWLADKIFSFDLTPENANSILQKENKTKKEQAFSTILKNRIFHGGIITKGSGLIKNGENGKGIKSRWYPKTLRDRIKAIGHVKKNMKFITGDAFTELEKVKNDESVYSFIDPPYTVAGRRLYTHFELDHDALFALTAQLKGKFMLTYDDTDEIRQLAEKYNLDFRTIPMKTTHHIQKNEIIVSDNFDWWK